MKISEIKNRSKEELEQLIKELRARIAQMNFDLADKKLKNTNQIKQVKKDIARVLTVLKINKDN
jgi:large subunit ribosomal protein L29